MRILFPYMARWNSANRTRFHHLLTGLARRGHQVVVLESPRRPASRETSFQEIAPAPVPGIEVRQGPRPPKFLWERALPFDKLFKKGLATLHMRSAMKAIDREHPVDVVLLYNIPQIALAGALRRPIAVDVADDLLTMLAHETAGWAEGAVSALARRAWGSLLARADLVTAASSVLAESLGPQAVLLPNGADLEAIRRADGSEVRRRHRRPVVGFVGAFEYFVDLDLVLDLASRLPECTFLLVGGGRDHERCRSEVQRRALANVSLPGPVPYADALNHIAAFDVALVPFKAGRVSDAASPLKLFEYVALKKPVVCTPSEEIRRIFGGRVYVGATAEECARLIRLLLSDPGAAESKAAEAYQKIETEFRWDRISQKFEELLVQVRDRRRP